MTGFGLIPVRQEAKPGESIFPTMVARVAMAIGESYDGYADPIATPNNWARAASAAVAAIEAMREPTVLMIEAAEDTGSGGIADDGAAEDIRYEPEAIWEAMIAAALTK